MVGGALLALDPNLTPYPEVATIGLGVIGLAGVVEWLVHTERWLAVEEALSCVAVITIVGWSGGHAPLVQGYLLARPGPPWPEIDVGALDASSPPPARAAQLTSLLSR